MAATCAVTGQAEGLIAPRLDTRTMNLCLSRLSRTLASDVWAVLVWDEVGSDRAYDLVCPPNITWVGLPPYSRATHGSNGSHKAQ